MQQMLGSLANHGAPRPATICWHRWLAAIQAMHWAAHLPAGRPARGAPSCCTAAARTAAQAALRAGCTKVKRHGVSTTDMAELAKAGAQLGNGRQQAALSRGHHAFTCTSLHPPHPAARRSSQCAAAAQRLSRLGQQQAVRPQRCRHPLLPPAHWCRWLLLVMTRSWETAGALLPAGWRQCRWRPLWLSSRG